MKKKMLMFRNQFLILGFGSLMIVSCSKEDLDKVFGADNNNQKNDTTQTNNGGNGCLTCGSNSIDSAANDLDPQDSTLNDGGGSIDSTLNDGGGSIDSTNFNDGGQAKDSSDNGGYVYFDSIYNNPNYDSKNGVLLTH